MTELEDELLVESRGRRRLSNIGDAVYDFVATVAGPDEVVGVCVVLHVALAHEFSLLALGQVARKRAFVWGSFRLCMTG